MAGTQPQRWILYMDVRPAFLLPEGPVDRYDDVELLVRIADRARNPADADAAFTIFFIRHFEFLRQACLTYHYSHPSFGAEDVVLRVMAAVAQGTAVFSPPDDPEPENVRRHLRGWLITVGRNQFYSEMRKLRLDRDTVPLDETLAADVTLPTYEEDDSDAPSPTVRTRILRFRDSLGAIDQLIFDRSLPYYDRATRSFNVPPAMAQSIAAEVGREVTAVRKRRERLMRKLRLELEAS